MRSLMRRVLLDTRYTLVGFPTTVITFALMLAGLAAGVGTAVAWIGVPVLAGTLMVARGFADAERGWLSDVLKRPPVRPRYKPAPAGAGRFRRLINPLTSGQSWLDLLHGIVNFPIALVAFVLTVVSWAIPSTGLTYPLYGVVTSRIPGNVELPELLGPGHRIPGQRDLLRQRGAVLPVPPAVHRARRLAAAGRARPGAADRRRRAARRASTTWPKGGPPPCRPRRTRCASWSATSTTARSSAWSRSPWSCPGRSAS